MFGQRAPWWMYLVAASYLGYAGLTAYVQFRGPENTGVRLASLVSPGPAVAISVEPDSPAARAGIRAGDQLVVVDGQRIRDALNWVYAFHYAEIGRPVRVTLQRGNTEQEVTLHLGRRTSGPRGIANWVRLARAALAFILAVFIAFSRPHDLQARVGALVLAEVGLFGLFFLNDDVPGLGGMLQQLPRPIATFIIAPLMSPGPALLFAFAAVFPRPFFHGLKSWLLVWTPLLMAIAVRVWYHVSITNRFARAPGWSKVAAALYLLGAVVVFIANYRRLTDPNERRRARVVAIGTVALIIAVLPYIVMISPGAPTSELEPVLMSSGVFVSLNLLSALFPLSVAYAVLRHRAFDIAIVIRQGLQYAVARRTVLAMLPVMASILAADLLIHRDEPLNAVLEHRGWVYAGLALAGVLAHRHQRQWMDALDRRFFRERYDAQRLLREVAEQVRESPSFEDVAPDVAERIASALHTRFAAVLMQKPGQSNYAVVASSPANVTLAPLSVSMRVLSLMRVLEKPMELTLTETGWLKQQLPPDESEFLRHTGIEWLIPIGGRGHPMQALIAVGSKRSEEPYTREDLDLLLAIAASMSLLLERPTATVSTMPRASSGDAFQQCPRCGSLYDMSASRCTREGAPLDRIRLPRLLGGRYRLERRMGGGGMGSVYEAVDIALERKVAVKVLREELADNTTAAERFRREARIAAAFSHPNVVTVHDFGLESGNRAFLVMEILEGVDLRVELKQKAPLPSTRVLEVTRAVCSGLESAHERGLTHRDVKPENIFLARTGGIEVPKILDFGLAKLATAVAAVSASATTESVATSAGHLVGTLRYMSPEQWQGHPAAASWDLWALAVVVYEMLSGAYPFAGATMLELQAAVVAGRFTPLVGHVPSAPANWQLFFVRTLADDPSKRPGTAREFLSQLELALTS